MGGRPAPAGSVRRFVAAAGPVPSPAPGPPPGSPLRAPSKYDVLRDIPGALPRFRARLKLLFMGQIRPWRVEDAMAMVSWIFVGHTIFFVVGTTTFVSLVLWVLNSLQFQEYLARKLSDYLTSELGVDVSFESAIVPNWKEGTIRLKNVAILRNGETQKEWAVKDHKAKGLPGTLNPDDVDVNFTYFDLKVENVDVSLSFWRWLEGEGILRDCALGGVRGSIDRRHVYWPADYVGTSRRTAQPGDFALEKLQVEDLLVTIHNPDFRPYTVSIFNGEVPLLRKQWVFYDLICADSMVGMFDNCLFSVQKAQRQSTTMNQDSRLVPDIKMSHLKIDGVHIDHLNAHSTGPFGWITSGTIDVDAYVMFPQDAADEDVLDILMAEMDGIKDKIEAALQAAPAGSPAADVAQARPQAGLRKKPKRAAARKRLHPVTPTLSPGSVSMHANIDLNNLKASVPLQTPDISYLNNALIRPIVAFLNANRTCIPLVVNVSMGLDKFDGAWTIYSCGLVDVISEEIGKALTALVQDERERTKRLKRVGLWTIQSVLKNFLALVDSVREFQLAPGFLPIA